MASAMAIQVGRGKGRKFWQIREFLADKGLSMSEIGRQAKTSPQEARDTIRGISNHGRVLELLEKLGCPNEYLYGGGDTLGRAA